MLVDMTGQRYGNLVCIEYTGKLYKSKSAIWLCQCDCGSKKELPRDILISGRVVSCGCMKKTQDKVNINSNKAGFIDGTCVSRIKSKKIVKTNTSGYTGVSFDKSRNKWYSQIRFRGKLYNLGRYTDKFDAVNARKKAEEMLYSDFIEWYEKEYSK